MVKTNLFSCNSLMSAHLKSSTQDLTSSSRVCVASPLQAINHKSLRDSWIVRFIKSQRPNDWNRRVCTWMYARDWVFNFQMYTLILKLLEFYFPRLVDICFPFSVQCSCYVRCFSHLVAKSEICCIAHSALMEMVTLQRPLEGTRGTYLK